MLGNLTVLAIENLCYIALLETFFISSASILMYWCGIANHHYPTGCSEENMFNKTILMVILLASLLAGCNPAALNTEPARIPTATTTLEFVQSTPSQPVSAAPPISIYTVTPGTPPSASQAVLDRAAGVVGALKNKDMASLSAYVHPPLGLRFSPYAAVKDTDLVFPADEVAGLLADDTLYNWGGYSSTGNPIELTFADYFSQFVYDVDFAAAPEISLDHRLGESTTLDNSHDFYPGAMIVEYYFPGFDPQYEGMDWRSLRLVFQKEKDAWYLVGIIHDQWTT